MAGYIGKSQGVTQVDGYNRSEADAEFVNDPNDVITVSGGNVGIGTSSPSQILHVEASGTNPYIRVTETGNTGIDFGQEINGNGLINLRDSAALRIFTGGTERMRLDSSGTLLVGKTATGLSNDGTQINADGRVMFTRDGNQVLDINRKTSDGDIVRFYKDGSTVGSIVCGAGSFYVGQGNTGLGFFATDGIVFPGNVSTGGVRDNGIDLGYTNGRFQDIYATNGTIQTSDRNEKQDIEVLSDAEQRVAVAAKGLLRKYRWKDAVAEKGDEARIHFGIIAQDLQAAFEAEGLDAGRYGMFISSTWWEAEVEKTREVEQEDGTTVTETYTATETYDEPTEGAVERTRLGVRYPELLAFIIAAL